MGVFPSLAIVHPQAHPLASGGNPPLQAYNEFLQPTERSKENMANHAQSMLHIPATNPSHLFAVYYPSNSVWVQVKPLQRPKNEVLRVAGVGTVNNGSSVVHFSAPKIAVVVLMVHTFKIE